MSCQVIDLIFFRGFEHYPVDGFFTPNGYPAVVKRIFV
jgi:hypothetical protein